ncbi:MAG TPA: hypothetical protein PL084_13810, partial [Chitinophagales bacterium]|nr:hypothetical protein [Chitinophagales bacterium]
PPGTPTPVATYNCSNGTVSLSAGTLGSNEQARWDTAASGGSAVSTNNPFSPTLTNTTNYYVTIYNTVSLCESSPRKPIVAYKKGLDAYNITRATGNTYSDISGGTAVNSWRNGSSNGNLSNNINIGFAFPYDGAMLSQFRVSTNGFITFNNASNASGDDLPACGNGDAYSGDNPIFSLAGREGTGQAIAPFYDDLIPNGYSLNSSIHYQLSGSAPNRVLTVQWRGMSKPVSSNCSSPCYYGNYNFQVKLYETSGNIEFVYGTMSTGSDENSKSYSCGLNSASLTASPDITQLLAQQTANTNTFSASPKNNHSAVPATNSKIAFARNVAEAAIAVPQCVNYNYPANNATAQCVNSILSWSPVDGAPTAYDVYFGTAANPPLKQSDV